MLVDGVTTGCRPCIHSWQLSLRAPLPCSAQLALLHLYLLGRGNTRMNFTLEASALQPSPSYCAHTALITPCHLLQIHVFTPGGKGGQDQTPEAYRDIQKSTAISLCALGAHRQPGLLCQHPRAQKYMANLGEGLMPQLQDTLT